MYIGQYNIELLMVLVPLSFLTKLRGLFVEIDGTFRFISTNSIYIYIFVFELLLLCAQHTAMPDTSVESHFIYCTF